VLPVAPGSVDSKWTAEFEEQGTLGKSTASTRLTKKVVDLADLSRGRHYLWDSELKGFGVQVEPTGTKTYIVRYRPKGLGRSGSRRFCKIGRHGDLTADQARNEAKTILAEVARGQDPAAASAIKRRAHENQQRALTNEQLCSLFLRDHAQALRKARTAKNYEILIRRHIQPCLGKTPAAEVTRTAVAALHLSMRENPANANRTLALISSVYSFASKRDLVPDGCNPARGVEKYREVSCDRYLTDDELQRLGLTLIEAETIGIPWEIDETSPNSKLVPKVWKAQRQVADPSAVAAIRLLAVTGARVREILDLRWEHVDFDRGLLFLPDSKTGKKTIVINGATSVALNEIKAKITNGARSGFVIPGQIANQPRADLNRPWRAIRRRADLEGVRLHDLRHTFASVGAGANVSLAVVGRLLGHNQPQTTARYAHLATDPSRRAADIIGDRIALALGGGGKGAAGGPALSVTRREQD